MRALTLSERLLRPGVRLMRTLTLPAKFGLSIAVLLVPMAMLLVYTVHDLVGTLTDTRDQRAGMRVAALLIDARSALQEHRLVAHEAVSGDALARADLPRASGTLSSALQALDAELARGDPFDLAERWAPVRARLAGLLRGSDPAGRAEGGTVLAAHTAAVIDLQELLLLSAERSRLLLDAQPASFFLAALAVERTGRWIETSEQIAVHGIGLLRRGDAAAAERARMLARIDDYALQSDGMHRLVAAVARHNPAAPASWDIARERSAQFSTLARAVFEHRSLAVDPQPFVAAAREARNAARRLTVDALGQLDELLTHRLRTSAMKLGGALGLCVLTLLLLVYLLAATRVGIVQSTRRTLAAVRAIADGDLSYRAPLDGRDEFTEIARQIETMSDRLSRMVAEIRSSATRVGEAGKAVAEEGRALSARTEIQAGTVHASVDTVERLGAAVAAGTRTTEALGALTGDLRRHAEEGAQAMHAAVATIGELQANTYRVADINSVIDEIAFQTNLLALNAAVEASHAGEAGKGFAVVAGEVRDLAQRCADAAAQIRELIGRTTEQTERSVAQVNEVHALLGAIAAAVGESSSRLQGLAEVGEQQHEGIRTFSARVAELDEITRDNADAVARSTRSSQVLADQAEALQRSVASVRARYGSADEARSLVLRARAHVEAVGWEDALRAFDTPGGAFVDRDMFVFAFDRTGRVLAYGGRPEWTGRAVTDLPGIPSVAADAFLTAALSVADRGEGWIEYGSVQHATGAPSRKSAYVAWVGPDSFLGCGVYREGATVEVAAAT